MAARGTRSTTAAARRSGLSRHMILKWGRRLQDTGNVSDAPRSGRPKALSDQACKHMERELEAHPGLSLRELAVMLHTAGLCDRVVSHATIKRALETRCPKVSRVWPLYKVVLTEKQKYCRVQFAKRHARRSWKNVLFVDACKFTYGRAQRHSRHGMLTYNGRRPLLPKGDDHVGLCVYGAVSSKGKSPLVFVTGSSRVAKTYKGRSGKRHTGVGAEEYINIMRAHLVPAGRRLHGSKLVYLHDWSGCHKSRAVRVFQKDARLDVMTDFPSRSPDLNIIENVWAWMDSQLRKKPYSDLDSFRAALIATWESIPLKLLQNCTRSMKARLRAVIATKGDRIKTQGL